MSRKITRRRFIGEASCAAVGSASLFSSLLNLKMANAAAAFDRKDDYRALVCLFLAGGNDSFNMLVPAGDPEYAEYQATRTDLALPKGALLPLKGTDNAGRTFGLHPAMPEVQQLYNSGDLAFVANVGTLVEPTTKAGFESGAHRLPVGLFSHIDQIAHWQTSVPDSRSSIGWGGRTADLLKSLNSNQDISMNISLAGTNTFQAGTTLVDYAIESRGHGSIGFSGFEGEYGVLGLLKKAAIESMLDLEYQNLFEQTFVNTTLTALNNHAAFSGALAAVPPLVTQFPENEVAQAFQMVARTIAARHTLGFRRQTFFILFGGWDHHDEVLNNQLAMLSVVSQALKAFNEALIELGVHDNVTTFTASDFARTLTSNSRGSDHAWGGNHLVMGGGVHGGRVYGEYPALYVDNPLDIGRGSLIPTLSCDQYFGELALWFGVAPGELATVLPNIGRFHDTASGRSPIGFMLNPAAGPPADVDLPTDNQTTASASRVPLRVAGLSALTAGALALRRRRQEDKEHHALD